MIQATTSVRHQNAEYDALQFVTANNTESNIEYQYANVASDDETGKHKSTCYVRMMWKGKGTVHLTVLRKQPVLQIKCH